MERIGLLPIDIPQGFSSTMYKNNSRFSSKFKGCSPLQLLCNLTGMKPSNGYYSYTNRWHQLKVRHESRSI